MDPDRKPDLDANMGSSREADVEAESDLETVARSFQELSCDELYDLLTLRAEVFVVEQHCPYLDPDGRDREATHLMIRSPDVPGSEPVAPAQRPGPPGPAGSPRLVACARWYPEGGSVHLGRIATAPEVRGRGLGRQLVREALERIAAEHPGRPVLIHAQAHLRAFYEGLGFRVTGEAFDEDGIEHLPMVRGPSG